MNKKLASYGLIILGFLGIGCLNFYFICEYCLAPAYYDFPFGQLTCILILSILALIAGIVLIIKNNYGAKS